MAPGARVIYLGFGPAGCACLEQLVRGGAEVVAVVPRVSDDGSGASSVRRRAGDLGVPLLETRSPSGTAFLEAVRACAPDYLVSVQYDRILKTPLLEIPALGSLNLHFSPLPRLRGCFPTKWAIIEDEPSGVTLHHIDPGIDTGRVVARRLLPLTPDDTDATLYARLQPLAIQLFGAHVAAIARGTLAAGTEQCDGQASYHPRGLPSNGRIDWQRDAYWIARFIRAMTCPPHAAAATTLGGDPGVASTALQIPAPTVVLEGETPGPGVLLHHEHGVVVGCGEHSLLFRRVLVDGCEQDAAEWLAGAPTMARFEETDAGSRQELTAGTH